MCGVKPFGELSKQEKMELLEAWVDGKEIEYLSCGVEWLTTKRPNWAESAAYRIKPRPVTKPSVDWAALHSSLKYLFKCPTGELYVSEDAPKVIGNSWSLLSGNYIQVDLVLSGLDKGTCNWKDSLVRRPEGV